MSIIKTTEEIEETSTVEEHTEAEVEILDYVDMPNGLPLFLNADKNTIDKACAMGFQIFYVLGIHRDVIEVTKNYANAVPEYKDGWPEPRIYKVVNNLVSRAILPVDNDTIGGLEKVEPDAWFNLPLIPYDLMQKIDKFFRRIDELYRTESIIVFTYDVRFFGTENESDGWGLVVPKQTNTAAHCNYDPPSVYDELDDEEQEFVRLVGTAHSHPGMGAFASGTDHGDQLGSDGIHITFGWGRSGPTAYHIEMQVGPKSWELEEYMVLEASPVETDEDIELWSENVTKEVPRPKVIGGQKITPPIPLVQSTSKSNVTATTLSSDKWGSPQSNGLDEFELYWNSKIRGLTIPGNMPHPTTSVIFVDLTSASEGKCPICHGFTLEADRAKRACSQCHSFLLMPGEKPEDVRDVRRSIRPSNEDSYITRWESGVKNNVPIIHVIRWKEGDNLHSMLEIMSGDTSKKA